jgi:glycosyltransferase involved in cell wall biosynthesis
MKILHVNTNDIRGGAARVAYSIHEEMAKLGHVSNIYVDQKFSTDQNVFTEAKAHGSSWLSRLSKKIIAKDLPSFISINSRDLFRKLIANDMEGYSQKILVNSKEYKQSDIVHLHNLHGNYFSLPILKKISQEKKLVWTLHDMWSFTGHCAHSYDCERWQEACGECPYVKTYPALIWDNTEKLLKKKKEIYSNLAINIVVPSLWLKDRVGKSILKNFPIDHIPNGIDTKVFKPRDKKMLRAELDLPQDKKIICYISAGGVKGGFKGGEYLEFLSKAFRGDKSVLFLCLGNKQKENVKKEENIWYLDYISSKDELAKFYSASDIFLFTSVAENFPLVILEAMATATPIVSFNVGGVCEAVQDKAGGCITKYKDRDDLIRGINYILNLNEKDKAVMSSHLQARARGKYDSQLMVQGYQKIYKRLLNT